jgi:uncharacterized protein with PQ loop repeat
MAPQTSIPIVANVLGTIGTVLWCVQLLPQIWTNYRTKKTDGLPGTMLFLWAICAVPFGAYAVAQNFNIPIQIQPQCFGTFSLVSWAQTLIYHNHWATWKATSLAIFLCLTFGGIEAALILTLKPLYDRGLDFPMFILGVIASILLALGLIPPYFEIWKRRGRVIGINWIFLIIDWSGAFFSLMALIAQLKFDVLGGVLYIICLFLEGGIVTSHLIWLFRTRKIRKLASYEDKSFDDIAEEHRQRNIKFAFSERRSRWSTKENELAEGSSSTGSDILPEFVLRPITIIKR